MSRKKTLVRNLLFAVVAAALGLICTGCCTMSIIQNLGTTNTEFTDYVYMMSPERDGIIVRSTRTIKYN